MIDISRNVKNYDGLRNCKNKMKVFTCASDYLYYYTFYHSDCSASDPANGAVTPTTAVHGNSVTFSCDQGYVIQGDARQYAMTVHWQLPRALQVIKLII